MRAKARKQQQGSATLELLIWLLPLIFLAFFSTYYHPVVRRAEVLQSLVDRYLQEAQYQGGFTSDMWASLLADMSARGLDPSLARFDGSTPVGEMKRRGEEIVLVIGYPRGDYLSIVKLIGMSPPDPNQLLWAEGSILSERP